MPAKKIKRKKMYRNPPPGHNSELTNGDWRKTPVGVLVKCPDCGAFIDLRNFSVLPDGQVAAPGGNAPKKLKCVNAGCTFHDHVELEGYDEDDPLDRPCAAGLGGAEPELTD